MDTVQDKTYETIYYSLWEAARRYSSFTQFRVIGKSHDDRMIPMLEIGQGDACFRNGWTDDGQAYQDGIGALQNI